MSATTALRRLSLGFSLLFLVLPHVIPAEDSELYLKELDVYQAACQSWQPSERVEDSRISLTRFSELANSARHPLIRVRSRFNIAQIHEGNGDYQQALAEYRSAAVQASALLAAKPGSTNYSGDEMTVAREYAGLSNGRAAKMSLLIDDIDGFRSDFEKTLAFSNTVAFSRFSHEYGQAIRKTAPRLLEEVVAIVDAEGIPALNDDQASDYAEFTAAVRSRQYATGLCTKDEVEDRLELLEVLSGPSRKMETEAAVCRISAELKAVTFGDPVEQ